jgi:hypothetical protein
MTGFKSKKAMAMYKTEFTGVSTKDSLDDLMYWSGLTAQGCWDELDEYAQTAILKFAELIINDCAKVCEELQFTENGPSNEAKYQRNLCALAIRDKFKIARR